jgi:putative chitinase
MLNLDDLRKLFPNAKYGYLEAIVWFSSGLEKAGITDIRLNHFLAQAAAETGGFTIREENGNYSSDGLLKTFPKYFKSKSEAKAYANKPQAIFNKTYGGRMGNNSIGDGFKYRGRGVFQITGKDSYKRFGDKLGLNLVDSPDMASDPQISIQLATLYWSELNLNEWADRDDILAISRGINGGNPKRNIQPNGMEHRRSWYAKIIKSFGQTKQIESGQLAEGDASPEVSRLQSLLRGKGYAVGSIDGIYGQATKRAVETFQREHNQATTGIWQASDWATLESAPNIQAERADVTPSDLHKANDPLVTQAAWGQRLLSWFGLGALVTGGTSSIAGSFPELVTQYQPVIEVFRPAIQWSANNGWLLVIVISLIAWFILRNIINYITKAYKYGDYQGQYKDAK